MVHIFHVSFVAFSVVELLQLFAKLNAGFTALASQLQVVHEAVRVSWSMRL